MDTKLPVFLELSTHLTGYTVVELQGTGMASTYLAIVMQQSPPTLLGEFWAVTSQVLVQGQGDLVKTHALLAEQLFPVTAFDGLAQNIIFMWYSGQWAPTVNASDANLANVRNISRDAYVQGLMWAAADTHPPGAKQPGFGSWAHLPASVVSAA